jgi:hypothetical protein
MQCFADMIEELRKNQALKRRARARPVRQSLRHLHRQRHVMFAPLLMTAARIDSIKDKAVYSLQQFILRIC